MIADVTLDSEAAGSVAKAVVQSSAMFEETRSVASVDTAATADVHGSVDDTSTVCSRDEVYAASAKPSSEVPLGVSENSSGDIVDSATSTKRCLQRNPDQQNTAGSSAKRARKHREHRAWKQVRSEEGVSVTADSDTALAGVAVEKQIAPRPTRAQVRAAELADFKARAEHGATIVLDLEWEASLSSKELTRVVQQVLFGYGLNRKAKKPARLVISGVRPGGETAAKLNKLSGFDGWPITVAECPYVDLFSKDQIVYLSIDATDAVTSIDAGKVYVLAGLVDDAKFRGRPLEKAKEQGISALRLPIAENVDVGSQTKIPVLAMSQTIQAVVEHHRLGDWRRAFEKLDLRESLNKD